MTKEVRVLKPRESKIETLQVPIIGTSPLIVNKFSEKAKREILEKQTKQARGLKEARDPQKEAEAGEHLTQDGFPAFPIVGFKGAIVAAARLLDFKMTEIRQAIAISGDPSAPLETAFEGAHYRDMVAEIIVPPASRNIREDVVKISGGVSMLRYRYEYQRWGATIVVSYNSEFLSEDQLAQLIHMAGQTVGIGEWRPERSGLYGTFRIGNPAEIEDLTAERNKQLANMKRKAA